MEAWGVENCQKIQFSLASSPADPSTSSSVLLLLSMLPTLTLHIHSLLLLTNAGALVQYVLPVLLYLLLLLSSPKMGYVFLPVLPSMLVLIMI